MNARVNPRIPIEYTNNRIGDRSNLGYKFSHSSLTICILRSSTTQGFVDENLTDIARDLIQLSEPLVTERFIKTSVGALNGALVHRKISEKERK